MAVLSKVTSKPGDLKWAAYSKWKGANDGRCEIYYVLEDVGHLGYGSGGWFCLPKWVGLEVEKKQWFQMGSDPEQEIIMSTLREVSVRLFPKKCAPFWERRKAPPSDEVYSPTRLFQHCSRPERHIQRNTSLTQVDKRRRSSKSL